METIPQTGKIFYIKDSKIQSENEIVDSWNKTIFLKPNKYCAILIGDTRRNKMYQPLAFMVMQDFYKMDFHLEKIL